MATRARISQTLRRALFYAFFGLVLPLGLVVLALFGSARNGFQRQLTVGLETASRQLNERFRAHFDARLARAQDFCSDGLLQQTLREVQAGRSNAALIEKAAEHFRVNKQPLDKDCFAVAVTSADGRLIFSTAVPFTNSLPASTNLAVFHQAAGFGPLEPLDKSGAYTIIAPVRPGTTELPLGYLVFYLPLSSLNPLLEGKAHDARMLSRFFDHQPGSERVYIADQSRTIIAGATERIGTKADAGEMNLAWQQAASYFGESMDVSEGERLGFTFRLEQPPWVVVASIPRAEALAPLQRWRGGALFFILCTGAVAMLIAALGAIRSVRPIQEVAEAAEAIAQGSADRRLPVDPRNAESARVSRSFNQMVDKLLATTSELRANETRYRTLVEQQLSGIYVIQEDHFAYVNPRMAEILEYTPEEMTTRPLYDFIAPDSQELARGNIRRRISGEVQSVRYQLHMLRKSGAIVDAEVHGSRMEYNGKPAILGTLLDITERNRAEQELRRSEVRFRQLADLGKQLNHTTTLHEAARIIAESANQLIRWNECEMHLYRTTDKTIVPLLQLKTQGDQRVEISLDAQGRRPPAIFEPVLCGEPLLVTQYHEDHAAGNGVPVTSPARASLMAVPIREASEVLGIICIKSRADEVYDNAALETLRALADYCAGAFERIGAENAVRQLNQDLEQRVAQRTAELQTVNQELESFSYSVSHDLRAPLRGVDGFAQALMEQYHDRLDDMGRSYVTRVRAAAGRMGQLIDDLLNLSKVTRLDMRREPVDLTGIALSVAAELQQLYPNRNVTFSAAPDVTVNGDARLLRVVLDNLIGNAWKFTSKGPDARVEFGKLPPNNGRNVYFVRDNGAGFDMKYAGKLFGAFQRLHGMSEFPGTGIGLATVQRILHRHGGRVWAEGVINQGATFFFEI